MTNKLEVVQSLLILTFVNVNTPIVKKRNACIGCSRVPGKVAGASAHADSQSKKKHEQVAFNERQGLEAKKKNL